MDYAENYTCKSQDEVQLAHWNQAQVTLNTSVSWFRNQIIPHVIISDTRQHNKSTVVPFTYQILSNTPDEVKHIKIWTDGPASEFKSQYVMASMPMLSAKHNVKLSWNFSATSHSKRPIDGVGATLKRQVMEKVQTRKCIINNASGFFNAVQGSNIKVAMINSTELEKYANDYLEKLFGNATLIQDISGYHFLETTDNGYVTKRYSSFINKSTATEVGENSKEVKIQAKVGCWYAFYLEKYQYWYIGMVLEICNERLTPLKVDFLQQLSQNANLFDSKEEILNVPVNSIFYALHNHLSPYRPLEQVL